MGRENHTLWVGPESVPSLLVVGLVAQENLDIRVVQWQRKPEKINSGNEE